MNVYVCVCLCVCAFERREIYRILGKKQWNIKRDRDR